MERPIYTLFQIIRENIENNEFISYDEPRRYYKMLRTIIGAKTGVFKGNDEILRLYKERDLWKDLLIEKDFSDIDILLLEERLRSIYEKKFEATYILDCYHESITRSLFSIFITISYGLFMLNSLNYIRIFGVSNVKYVFNWMQNISATGSSIGYKLYEETC